MSPYANLKVAHGVKNTPMITPHSIVQEQK